MKYFTHRCSLNLPFPSLLLSKDVFTQPAYYLRDVQRPL